LTVALPAYLYQKNAVKPLFRIVTPAIQTVECSLLQKFLTSMKAGCLAKSPNETTPTGFSYFDYTKQIWNEERKNALMP
ncbi:hypothetical protein T265_16234, partial [Opisthorchis viverrini]